MIILVDVEKNTNTVFIHRFQASSSQFNKKLLLLKILNQISIKLLKKLLIIYQRCVITFSLLTKNCSNKNYTSLNNVNFLMRLILIRKVLK